MRVVGFVGMAGHAVSQGCVLRSGEDAAADDACFRLATERLHIGDTLLARL